MSLFNRELLTKLRELTAHVKLINVRCERIVCYPGTLANLIEMVFSSDDALKKIRLRKIVSLSPKTAEAS